MIDVVYPLSDGSIWDNNELRYSIRSLEKNLIGLRNIFIVGDRPDFLDWSRDDLFHVICGDPFLRNKDGNLILKTITACGYLELSENFLRLSDDQMIIKPISPKDIKPLYLFNYRENNSFDISKKKWRRRLGNTLKTLVSENKTAYHYDTHIPGIYNKNKFPSIMKRYNHMDGSGYTINTLYFNNLDLPEHIKLTDEIKCKVEGTNHPEHLFLESIKSAIYLGYNNRGLKTHYLKQWITNNFPQKSRFEI